MNYKLLGVIIYKLLNIRFKVVESNDFNHLNNLLNQYNIDCFQHRVIIRLSRFVYKIINYNTAPLGLKSSLIRNLTVKDNYNLRNKNEYLVVVVFDQSSLGNTVEFYLK